MKVLKLLDLLCTWLLFLLNSTIPIEQDILDQHPRLDIGVALAILIEIGGYVVELSNAHPKQSCIISAVPLICRPNFPYSYWVDTSLVKIIYS